MTYTTKTPTVFRYLHWKFREFFKGYKQIFQWVLHGLLLYDVSTWKAPFQMVFGEKSWSLSAVNGRWWAVFWYMFSDQGHQRPWRKTTGWCLGLNDAQVTCQCFRNPTSESNWYGLMEEIRRSPVEVGSFSHGGCLGFLPSTVWNEENLDSSMNLSLRWFLPPWVFCLSSSRIID